MSEKQSATRKDLTGGRIYLRIHRWVLWWFYVGVACGAVALANILLRDLTRTQESVILVVGVLHWVLGGLVCYAFAGIQVDVPSPAPKNQPASRVVEESEWHPASDFVLPGRGGKLLLRN